MNIFKLFSPKLTDEDLELLRMLGKDPLNNWHRENFKNADKLLKYFLMRQYLRHATKTEIISKYYRLPELKALCKDNKISIKKMKKAEIINALISNLSTSEVKKLIYDKEPFLILTDEVRKLLDDHKQKLEAKKQAKRLEIESILIKKQYKLLRNYSKAGFNLSGNSIDIDIPFIKSIVEQAYNDLEVPEALRLKLAVALATSEILGECTYDMAVCFLEILDESKIHVTLPNVNISKIMDKDDYFELVEIYVRTHFFKINSLCELSRFKNSSNIIGVYISCACDERSCSKCMSLHNKKFSFSSAPKLPLHWGCRCTYRPIFKD